MTDLVAVMSGGQDSSTSVALKMSDPNTRVVGAIHFGYGQEHSIERECAEYWANKYDVPLFEILISSLNEVGKSALTGTTNGALDDPHPNLEDVPASFVPGRNIVLFTLAAAKAMTVGADGILSGVCQRDYSGYPDCREETLHPLEETIREGMDYPEFSIVTPLLNRTKAETWAMADEVGVVDDVIEHTHTCYKGNRSERHEWGYGCGSCPACEIRAEGWEAYRAQLRA